MTFDPLYLFVFVGLFSPGPNVILLTASGARFGFRRTLPHVMGIAIGVGITAGITALGLAAVLLELPVLALAFKVIAALWILLLAWRMLRSTRTTTTKGTGRPFTFFEAVLFQWVNPKVWAVAIAATAGYSAGLTPGAEAIRMATTFATLNLFVCLFWSFAGQLLARLLASPRAWKIFMVVMAMLLALSAVMVFF